MKTEVEDLVIMGRIVAPYGILGWIKVSPDTELVDGLAVYKTWQIGKNKDWKKFKLTSTKVHHKLLLAKLEGVQDRNAALACKGLQVAVLKSALPKAGKNEYYWVDLVGLGVKNQQNVDFGHVVEVLKTGANDVLVVSGQPERLIPFVYQVIVEVSLEKKILIVNWDEDF